MSTKNNPGAFDCYAAAAPDEPMFILLGRDRHAPVLVRLWALLRHRAGEDEAKVQGALDCAEHMAAHRAALGKPPEEKPGELRLGDDLIYKATEGMTDHPEGFDLPCDCNLCRSYGA